MGGDLTRRWPRRVPWWPVVAAVVLIVVGIGVLAVPRGVDSPAGGRVTPSATRPPTAPPTTAPVPPGAEDEPSAPSVAPALTVRLSQPVSVSRVSSGTPLLTASYTAAAGESRLVTARVVSNQPADRPPDRTGVQLTIECNTDGDAVRRSLTIENVQRGSTITQSPRILYTAPREGRVICRLTGLPFYGEGGGASVGSRVYVLSGARLDVSTSLPDWAREVTWDHPRASAYRSELVVPGGRFLSNPASDVEVPTDVRRVEVQTDHKVTNCWFRGGSSDDTTVEAPVTGPGTATPTRRDLCPAPNPQSDGVQVGLYVRATRLAADGSPCAPPTVVRKSRWVSGPAHHARLMTTTPIDLPPVAACSGVLRVRTWVENQRPATGTAMPLVVHAPGERIAVLPADVRR